VSISAPGGHLSDLSTSPEWIFFMGMSTRSQPDAYEEVQWAVTD